MSESRCCAWAFGGKSITEMPGWEPQQSTDAFAAIADPHTRELLNRLYEIRNFWLRSPDTWEALGEYLRALDRPVTIWVGGSWTGREGFSAALTCEHAGVRDWRVEVLDTNKVFISESAGPRGGRFKTHEVLHDTPSWAAQYFDFNPDGKTARIREQLRKRVAFTVGDFTRDEPPPCDLAVVSDVWRRPTAAQRQEQERFPHREIPVLSLSQRRALAQRIHQRLQPGGLLMLTGLDVIDLSSVNWPHLMHGHTSGAAHYDPPDPVTELFEPLHPNGPPFQLLWSKRSPGGGDAPRADP